METQVLRTIQTVHAVVTDPSVTSLTKTDFTHKWRKINKGKRLLSCFLTQYGVKNAWHIIYEEKIANAPSAAFLLKLA